MPIRILIIEDDLAFTKLLSRDLIREGYEVVAANNGLEGLRLFHATRPDLILLDIAMPFMDGTTVCQRIRVLSEVPILMMTARPVTEQQIAQGLDLGADEFMLKPLRHIEFHARIKALLRRARPMSAERSITHAALYEDPYLMVDTISRRVEIRGQEVRLTPTEFRLLATLIRHREEVLTFQELLGAVWGPEYHSEHHYPRIYVSHLRRKIEPDSQAPTYIQNEYGIGYRFVGQRKPSISANGRKPN
ncbi:MAG: response regulator transcription factor [Anaerolineae bacterium]|nr:response regulator transcription factor [Anaerolineae bacterium]